MEIDGDVRGVLVTDVRYDSEAADKGIARRMVIVGVNGDPVRDLDDWEDAVENLSPGSPVKLDVLAGSRGFYVYVRVPRS